MARNFHESFDADTPELPSERSTGLVLAVAAAVVALLMRDQAAIALVAGAGALVLTVLSLAAPGLLGPVNRGWFAFGMALNRVVSPVVMLLLYAIAIVPFGLAMQLVRDPMRRKRDAAAVSYWIERGPVEAGRGMRDQF